MNIGHKYIEGQIVVYGKHDRQIFIINRLSRGYNNVLRYHGINGYGDLVTAHENKMRPAKELEIATFNNLTSERDKNEN